MNKEYWFGKYKVLYTDETDLEQMLDIFRDEYCGICECYDEDLVEALRREGIEVEEREEEEE